MDCITSAKVVCQVTYGISYWEINLKYASGRSKGIEFPLSEAKNLKITQRLNGTKKLANWLNSSEGLHYLNKNYL